MPAQADAMQELTRILERIPNINFSQVGSKIVVEGEQLTSHQRQQLMELKQQYAQLLDFTYPVVWEYVVLLDVQVVEVPKNALMDLGFRWSETAEGGVAAGVAWDAGSHKLVDRPGETVVPMPFMPQRAGGYFGVNALMRAKLNALTQTGQAIVLARPQLLARSGATAEFLAGGEVPYSALDAQGNPQTQFKPYGVALKITPHIERSEEHTSELQSRGHLVCRSPTSFPTRRSSDLEGQTQCVDTNRTGHCIGTAAITGT